MISRVSPASWFPNWLRMRFDPLSILPQDPSMLKVRAGKSNVLYAACWDAPGCTTNWYYKNYPTNKGFPPALDMSDFKNGVISIGGGPGVRALPKP